MSSHAISPAAERNKEPIRKVLGELLPPRGVLLEIGSGTGQHTAYFAAHFEHLVFQPSDRTLEWAPQIEAQCRGLRNARRPIRLDVLDRPWSVDADFIFNANMIHISPWTVTLALFEGASQVLQSKCGICMATYGPYFEANKEPAPSNLAFDASLRQRDPSWGIRQKESVQEVAERNGFSLERSFDMPANNLLLAWSRP
ncbi:MAG: DUF938 domain-containing protein [Myxococcota bacterium]